MKVTNFRIIELESHQVLLTKDFDNEQDDAHYLIAISFFLDWGKASLKLSYSKEKMRNDMFEKINKKEAQGMVDNALQMEY